VPDLVLEVALEIGRDVIVVEQRIVDIDEEDDRIGAVMPGERRFRSRVTSWPHPHLPERRSRSFVLIECLRSRGARHAEA